MRKMMILAAGLAFAAGCSSQPKSGIGVVPLGGATVTGKVVEAGEPSGVLMKTQSERSFLLPDNWKYQQNGRPVEVKELTPGSTVTAIAPAQEARLVAASDNNLVLESDRGFFSFPAEGLAPAAQQAPVQVQTLGGQYREMPLLQAMEAYPTSIRSHPYYEDYAFQTASPYSVAKGIPVGSYMNSPLMLAPTSQGIGLVQAPQAYPVQSFTNHQPVRFTYRDDNVAVSSWNSLGDSQFNLSNLLLAGTLLDILPGQAVIQVGQSPLTVPWNYVTYQGAPVGDRRFPVGTPLNVAYYPGAYDLISYDNSNVTFLYDQYPVQVPVSYLPGYVYDRPVRVRRGQGPWVNMPFQSACRLVDSGSYVMAPSPVAMPYMNQWRQTPVWDPRPIRGLPDYHLVGIDGRGPARAVRKKHRHPHRDEGWWAYRPDWSYTLAGLAGPAAWNLSHQYRDRAYQQPAWPVAGPRHDRGRHLGWADKPAKSKRHPWKQVAREERSQRPWWVEGDHHRRPKADHRKPGRREVRDSKRDARVAQAGSVWSKGPDRHRQERREKPRFGKNERRVEKNRHDDRRVERAQAPLVRREVGRSPRRAEGRHRVAQAPRQQRRERQVSPAPRQRGQHRVAQAPRQQRQGRTERSRPARRAESWSQGRSGGQHQVSQGSQVRAHRDSGRREGRRHR